MAHLWRKFEQFHLTENMRLIGRGPEELDFAQYLLTIGNGSETSSRQDQPNDPSAEVEVSIPSKLRSTANTVEEFCAEIYPNLKNIIQAGLQSNENNWHEWLTERAIICPTNDDVSSINDILIKSFPGQMHTYKSFDRCSTDGQVSKIDVFNRSIIQECAKANLFFLVPQFP